MEDQDGKLRRQIPEEPGKEWLPEQRGPKILKPLLEKEDKARNRAIDTCDFINLELKRMRAFVVKVCRKRDDPRSWEYLRSFASNWCSDSTVTLDDVVSAYAVAYFGVGGVLLLANKDRIRGQEARVIDIELVRSVSETLVDRRAELSRNRSITFADMDVLSGPFRFDHLVGLLQDQKKAIRELNYARF